MKEPNEFPQSGLYTGGLSDTRIRTLIKRGQMTRLGRGILVWGTPSPLEAAQALCAAREEVFITGDTLAQLVQGEPVTFPIHVAVQGSTLPPSQWYVSHRYQQVAALGQRDLRETGLLALGLRAEAPVGAARVAEQPITLLENYYSGRTGKTKLLRDLKGYKRTPPGIQELLNQAAIGADSVPERDVVRLLRAHGFKVSCNVRVGDYLWDAALDDFLVLIDVDGFRYHKGQAEKYDTFVTDRWKTNAAISMGYLPFRYAARCVSEAPHVIVDQIRDACTWARRTPRSFSSPPAFVRGVRSWHPYWVVPERDYFSW